MIGRGLDLLATHATWLLAAGVLCGLALPDLAAFLRPLMAPSVWVLLFFSMVRIDWDEIVGHAGRPLLMAAVVVWLLAVSALAMWAVVGLVPLSPGLAAGLVLMTASAPIMASPAFCMLLGLDVSLSLVTMVAATLALPLTLPVIAIEILGLQLTVDVLDFMARLAGMIGSALLAALLARRFIGAEHIEAHGRDIEGLVVIALVVFAASIMDGVTAAIISNPRHMAVMVAAAFAANLVLQAAGAGGCLWLGRRQALTIGFSTGNRNMGILLAVLPETTAADTLLFFAVAQIPMYMLPAMLTPVYRAMLGGNQPDERPPP